MNQSGSAGQSASRPESSAPQTKEKDEYGSKEQDKAKSQNSKSADAQNSSKNSNNQNANSSSSQNNASQSGGQQGQSQGSSGSPSSSGSKGIGGQPGQEGAQGETSGKTGGQSGQSGGMPSEGQGGRPGGQQGSPESNSQGSSQGSPSGSPGQDSSGQKGGQGAQGSPSKGGEGGAGAQSRGGTSTGPGGSPGGEKADDNSQASPRAETSKPGLEETVAPKDQAQTDLTIRRVRDLLEKDQVTPELLNDIGMTKEELNQFVKKYEKAPKPEATPDREIEVKPGQTPALDPNTKLPSIEPGVSSNTQVIRDRGGIARDSARNVMEAQRFVPPPELRSGFDAYRNSLSRSKAVSPARRGAFASPPAKTGNK